MSEIVFDFYGVSAKVSGPDVVINNLSMDFSYFKSERTGGISFELTINNSAMPFERVPPVKASLYQPDSVSYDKGGSRYVDYHGKALSIYDYIKEKGELYGSDEGLLHELAYLIILSRVGEMLDKMGMHRVHSFGFSIKDRGVLCLMPQGGGKTTLYLELLKNENVKLISDDTPLITRDSKILPFPLRIGVSEGTVLNIPQKYIGSIDRRKYGRKKLIDAAYFAGRISSPVGVAIIIKCDREYSDNPRIIEAGKISIFLALFRDCIAGLGLPQMVEYFLRFSFRDMLSKVGIVISRTFACVNAVMKAKTYSFVIGTDTTKNVDILTKYIQNI